MYSPAWIVLLSSFSSLVFAVPGPVPIPNNNWNTRRRCQQIWNTKRNWPESHIDSIQASFTYQKSVYARAGPMAYTVYFSCVYEGGVYNDRGKPHITYCTGSMKAVQIDANHVECRKKDGSPLDDENGETSGKVPQEQNEPTGGNEPDEDEGHGKIIGDGMLPTDFY